MTSTGPDERGSCRVVLFDMDDTIFDHSLTCRDAISALRREEPLLRRRTLRDLWRDYLELLDVSPTPSRLGLTPDEARTERWRCLASSCGVDLSPETAAGLSRRYRHHYQQLRRPVPGSVELLRRLHARTAIAIVTNNETAEQEEKLRFLGLEEIVDHLVVSEEVGAAKPDPRIFRVALDRSGALPEESVMLGDSWPRDVVGALAAGVRPVWFNRFALPRPDGTQVEELRSLLPLRRSESALLGVRRPLVAEPADRPSSAL